MQGSAAPILRDQLVKAVSSISANIAEGSGKKSDRDFARYVRISLGSSTEAENHLLVIQDLCLMDRETCSTFQHQVEDVRKMLAGLEKRLSSDANARSSRQPRRPRSF
jgi:four helix bundle protein